MYTRAAAKLVVPTFWWTVVIAGFGGWMIVVIQQMGKQLEDIFASGYDNIVVQTLERAGGGKLGGAVFASAIFQFLPIMLMAFAVTQVNAWASDEENGRLVEVRRRHDRCSRAGAANVAQRVLGAAGLALVRSN